VTTGDARLWFEVALLPSGWARSVRVRVRDGRIAEVEHGVTASDDDERHHSIALPGLANVHSHGFQRAMAGLTGQRGPENDNFWTWREVMYHFVGRLGPDEVHAISALAFVEMLESGFTCVGEFHYVHHAVDGRPYDDVGELAAQVVAAAEQTGIGLTLLPVFYAHASFGELPPSPGQRRFVCGLDDFRCLLEAAERHARRLPDAVVGVAPHSLRAVNPRELAAVAALRPDAPLHIHAAEQVREVEDCVAWSGQRPVAWLLDHADVDARWCLVHATHIDDTEIRGIIDRGAVVGLCPVTESDLGDGIFPALPYTSRGGRFGIGTDSNVMIDAAVELRTLEYGQRLLHRSRNVLASRTGASTGRTLFDAALAGGAQAVGRTANGPAGIAPGEPADLFTLDPTHIALIGRSGDAVLDSWVFGARSSPIDRVWRHGRCVVRHGRHVSRDAVEARFRAAVQRLAST
jgi:formimidoylglutamate deiminase